MLLFVKRWFHQLLYWNGHERYVRVLYVLRSHFSLENPCEKKYWETHKTTKMNKRKKKRRNIRQLWKSLQWIIGKANGKRVWTQERYVAIFENVHLCFYGMRHKGRVKDIENKWKIEWRIEWMRWKTTRRNSRRIIFLVHWERQHKTLQAGKKL